MAQQVSAFDAQFLNFETGTNLAHIAALTILDPSGRPGGALTREDLIALLKRRLHLAPPLRRRLVEVPFGLDHPYWAEDREVDFDYHVRDLALPPPGDDHKLAEQVARLHGTRLDRGRPLWEIYLIHGLAGGRVAIYTKVHHAAVDGVTGAEVLTAVMDFEPEPAAVPAPEAGIEPQQAPDAVEMVIRGVARVLDNPFALLRFIAEAVPRLDEVPFVAQLPGAGLVSRFVRGIGGGDAEPLPELPRTVVPRTPFSGRISRHRRFAFGQLPLDEVKRIKNAFGVTVNDVVMAMCATALRRWLAKRDELPRQPLVAGIPVSTRGQAANGSAANEVMLTMTTLPTDVADPRDRLLSVNRSMSLIKERLAAASAAWLLEFSQAMPAALSALAARSAFRIASRAAPAMNLLVSNVPGPQTPLYVCGARVTALYPMSVITDVSGGINITVFSYDGRLGFGIVTDRDMVPDVWDLIDYLRDSLAEYGALAAPPEQRTAEQGKPAEPGKPGKTAKPRRTAKAGAAARGAGAAGGPGRGPEQEQGQGAAPKPRRTRKPPEPPPA
ncbi:wax ester/triacylglycerol synthase family O-acyltransferase [Microbispora sp. KK1-11]|uniref:WS/DGAT/MGAT family O-acyltransferase n=1 Tax=Microbispora sp. KK1-11 TaxID=2053005 RepID=UPI00115B8599|nr:wax ester/triacylglycerol synthase family O-acyltransferase [Microbispora sp. KK1-11]TQS28504.1 wax ester/triacylglycerol synthase family O-acyltransferase [Microbispora sp. KK1-11]